MNLTIVERDGRLLLQRVEPALDTDGRYTFHDAIVTEIDISAHIERAVERVIERKAEAVQRTLATIDRARR